MDTFIDFLQNLSNSANIKFKLIGDDGMEIFSSDDDVENYQRVYFPIVLGKTKIVVNLNKKYEGCVSLLKYTIENKYKELFSMTEQLLIDILEGKDVPIDQIDKNLPFLSKGCTIFVVSINKNVQDALNIVKQLYDEQDALSILYRDNIIIIGYFEDIEEHAKGIHDSIELDSSGKCFISYANIVHSVGEIKKAYEDAKECMILGKKFDIKQEIYDYNKMLFEKIVCNINVDVKNELMKNFKEKLNLFDSEMIITIEEFVNCGLNISDAARKLYIHRNTLIYRLDKIKKETGFDIRNFKDATVFIIAFLVWKENK